MTMILVLNWLAHGSFSGRLVEIRALYTCGAAPYVRSYYDSVLPPW